MPTESLSLASFRIEKAIGDLSLQDRKVLKWMAEKHDSVLEIGVGASTQILTHYAKGKTVSYDTDPKWIERTKYLFGELGVKGECEFRLLDHRLSIEGKYNFVFIDCAREFRLPAAFAAWECLAPEGCLAFHDTRRDRDIDNAMRFLGKVFREVGRVEANYENSNITVIWKRADIAEYVNWHKGATDKELGIDWLK